MSKSKVLSVRLTLEALQSCFDLCEALGVPTNGASGAIARSIETLTRDLRHKGTLPTYTPSELNHLVAMFVSSKNPTSMASLEASSIFEARRSPSGLSGLSGLSSLPRQSSQNIPEQNHYTNEDFAPLCSIEQHRKERSFDEVYQEKQEYDDLLEEKILEEIQKDEEALLRKILIGG